MTRKISFLALLIFAIQTLFGSTENIRIMTYNVPKGNIPAEGVNTWANRAKGLQKYLLEVKPDLLGMQEPVRDELMDILCGMPNYAMLGVARDNAAEGGEYSPIIYRTERFLVEQTGTYWLSLTPTVVSRDWSSACNRIATWAVFRDKQTGARFLYTNTHLDHKSDEAREHQMEVIKEHMAEQFAKYGDMPAMLTGDFNITTSGSAYNRATSYKFTMNDAWVIAESKSGNGITFASDPSLSSSLKKIDYIMLTPSIKVSKAYVESSVKENGQILSDHNPHYADIYFETSESEDNYKLLTEALSLYDSTRTYVRTPQKLITNANDGTENCQLSSDGAETSQGQYYRNLIDNNTATFFHSRYSSMPPNNPHYLQVDLQRDDVRYISFDYQRRDDKNYGIADRWQDVMITASNDQVNWDYIDELYDFGSDELTLHSSPVMDMHDNYRYVRFSVMHTPAEKIRNANPQFTCSEFQVYTAELNENCQFLKNKEVNVAADNLFNHAVAFRKAMRENRITSQQVYDLKFAIEKLRSVYVNKTVLFNMIKQAENLLNTFPAGSKLGNSNKEAYEALSASLLLAQQSVDTISCVASMHNIFDVLNEKIQGFTSSIKTFEEGKWYHIYSSWMLSSNTRADAYGQAIYQSSSSRKESVLRSGYYQFKRQNWECLQNPYAMWRFVSLPDGGYAVQNRATGQYMGISKDTSVCLSATPFSYKVELVGPEDLRFTTINNNTVDVLLSVNLNSAVKPSKSSQSRSEISWSLKEVNDAEIGFLLLPVKNHSVSILTLPCDFDVSQTKADVKIYSINSMPTTASFTLTEQQSVKAATPFVLITGKIEELNADATDNVDLVLPTYDEYPVAGLVQNGMHGVLLEDETPSRIVYFFLSNQLHMSSAAQIPAMTGYVLRTEVDDQGGSIDAIVSRKDGVTDIAPVLIKKENNGNTLIYNLNGQSVASPQIDVRNLPTGIYIINGKKILKH